jgi:ribosomal protein S12 methylthiotransferase
VEAAELDWAGVFCYSPEAGTPAAEMPEQVPAEEAGRRRHEVMVLQQRISLARNQRWVGREIDVLIEAGGEADGEWVGRSFRDAPEIDGTVKVQALGKRLAAGQFVRAEVVEAEPYDLRSRLR